MKRLTITLTVGIIAALVTSDVHAQRRVPHFRRTPVISPHISLFRADNGGLNSFVGAYAPRVQMQQFMDNTTQQFQYQQNTLMQNRATLDRDIQLAIEKELQDGTQQGSMLQMRPTTSGGVGSTRTAGTFMGHARYFPGAGAGSGRSAGGGRRVPLPTSGRSLSGSGSGGFGGGF